MSARQEQRFRVLQHQFQILKMEVQARTSSVSDSPPTDPDPDLETSLPSRPHSRGQTEPSALADLNVTSSGQTYTHQIPRLEKLTDNDKQLNISLLHLHVLLVPVDGRSQTGFSI